MSLRNVPRQGACMCGSREPLAACCLLREEAFQRLVARVLAFAEAPDIRREAEAAADLFWGAEEAGGKRRRADTPLRFLEWFLQDYAPDGSRGTHLAEFADQADDLPALEAQLLLAWLLSPVRAYEVAESPSVRGLTLKELLTGEECPLIPFGVDHLPIRSDLVVCRTVPFGRVARAGIGIIRLPAGSREELSAYLRMAYQVSRAPRHVSLEDFLGGSPHLYHHFFLTRGVSAGAEAWETVRGFRYASGRAIYRVEGVARLRATLSRQPTIEPEAPHDGAEGYAWIDPLWAVPRARFALGAVELTVSAESREDLAAAVEYVGRVLQGLALPVTATPPSATPAAGRRGGTSTERWGRQFLRRAIAVWPDTALPALGNRSPQEAVLLPALRRSVAGLLGGLERDLARQKRLGRAWADVSGLWESLGIADLAPAQPGVRHVSGPPARESPRAGGRRKAFGPRREKRDHHR